MYGGGTGHGLLLVDLVPVLCGRGQSLVVEQIGEFGYGTGAGYGDVICNRYYTP